MLVAVLIAVTVAPGTTLPAGSKIVPETFPSTLAHKMDAMSRHPDIQSAARNRRSRMRRFAERGRVGGPALSSIKIIAFVLQSDQPPSSINASGISLQNDKRSANCNWRGSVDEEIVPKLA
jgi:hypothetical protein